MAHEEKLKRNVAEHADALPALGADLGAWRRAQRGPRLESRAHHAAEGGAQTQPLAEPRWPRLPRGPGVWNCSHFEAVLQHKRWKESEGWRHCCVDLSRLLRSAP